ncbi:MAG: succinate dehydrogenase, hydrophobic membrane anchor protein [Usitatibacter sp.]
MKKSVTGLRAWLVQRISAVCMLLFIVFVLFHFLFDPPRSYVAWHGWVMSPGVSVATFVFFAALLMHAWVGIRDVVMDYVRPVALRFATLALLGLCLLAIAAWVGRILLMGRG